MIDEEYYLQRERACKVEEPVIGKDVRRAEARYDDLWRIDVSPTNREGIDWY